MWGDSPEWYVAPDVSGTHEHEPVEEAHSHTLGTFLEKDQQAPGKEIERSVTKNQPSQCDGCSRKSMTTCNDGSIVDAVGDIFKEQHVGHRGGAIVDSKRAAHPSQSPRYGTMRVLVRKVSKSMGDERHDHGQNRKSDIPAEVV